MRKGECYATRALVVSLFINFFHFPTSKRSPTRRWFLFRLTFSLGAQLLKGRLGGGAVPLLVSDLSGARCAWIASAMRAPRDGRDLGSPNTLDRKHACAEAAYAPAVTT